MGYIEVSRRFEASNCRDKIFALRGLVCDQDRLLEPDYEQPVPAVLMNVVEFLVRSWANLHILLGNRFEVNPDSPSWTPDLGSRLRGDTTLRIFNKTFKADNGKRPTVKVDKSLGTLSCRGLLLAATTRVIGPFIQGQKPADEAAFYQELNSCFGNHQFFTEICDFSRSLTETDKTQLCRTLVMDHDSTIPGEDPLYPAPAEFVNMMQALFEQKPVPDNFMPEASRIDRFIQYVTPFSKSMENASSNRCFFVTESGGMGMGPFSTKPDDIIVVLFGSPFCLVLRSVQGTDCYSLIGDAYVHGAMDGGFVKAAKPDDHRTFVLV
ncbi:heterokaryon incompatibility 6 OR allele [Fusarium tjaetaba]|uniref:Heterokaryon incompatibility 6 OR allele n=1 Tax=Fusarium tjaetaba TaxID=1567544 RepID=A0A8H5VHB2_9HYPO|nr:heterokaryon incompatibility 6 OR allele [Fusarium tjaetaba]KAF5621064.1 heterokaryon incompatibility 6 OR allele [Fusarium tjaetaba]